MVPTAMRTLPLRVVLCTLLATGCATASEDLNVLPRVDGGRTADSGDANTGSFDGAPTSDAVADTRSDGSTDTAAPGDTGSAKDTGATATDAGATATDTGATDTGPSIVDQTVNLTECAAYTCPLSHPYIAGCTLSVGGGSSQFCIIYSSSQPTLINFKEGQNCGSETVSGTIRCSDQPTTGPNASNCTSNKSELFITTISACPG